MRIVMIGPFGMHPRSTMRVRALPMAKALVARGHQVAILLPPWQNREDEGTKSEEEGVAVSNIPLPPHIPGIFHFLTASRLARRALSYRPDVIHLFKPKAYSGLAHRLLTLSPRARNVRLVVDTDDWEGAGGWNEIGEYTSIERVFFAWQERWGLTHADAVTVASRTLEGLVWSLGVEPGQVHYVPNGVWNPPAVRQPRTAAQPTILLYTRFFEFPVSRVIQVLRQVRENVPDARLLVVGKGFFEEEDELLSLAQEAGLADAVEYVGWIPEEALGGYFDQASVAIYPFEDTLINRTKCAVKLLDLLTAGVPVIAEAVGQNREMIRHGETGWLVASGNIGAFSAAVIRLLDDRGFADRLGQAAADDVRSRFTWAQLVDDVELAYKRHPRT
jgi:glycosyltransferase involved in cell wall biosynthesis